MSIEKWQRNLLEAAAFAARSHDGQRRKDGRTPYVSHVFRVCLIVRHVFDIADEDVLAAALLHDTIEDTTVDFDDLEERFGKSVAHWAAALSKDGRLPESERELAYIAQLRAAPWQVQACKLADVYDNLMDSSNLPRERRAKVLHRSESYFEALRQSHAEELRRPLALVAELLEESKSDP